MKMDTFNLLINEEEYTARIASLPRKREDSLQEESKVLEQLSIEFPNFILSLACSTNSQLFSGWWNKTANRVGKSRGADG